MAEVNDVIPETPRVKTLLLGVPGWPGHLPGQHVDVRLTGEDGYQAQRSYSIASTPEALLLSLTVERLSDGEVSRYLVEERRDLAGLELLDDQLDLGRLRGGADRIAALGSHPRR